jgi:hypothetical protein
LEANERYNRFVEGLSSELDRADQQESQLLAIQNECSEACKNAEAVEAEKRKLEAEVEKLEAKKAKPLIAQDHSESLLIRFRAKYDQCKAKTKHLLKSWGRGFNWGFENFQTLTTNPQYKFNPRIVGPLLVGILDEAIESSCPTF